MKRTIDKRKLFGGILGTLLFLICVIGFTFAFYSWRSPDDSDVAVGFTVDDLGGAIIYNRDNGESGNGVISGTLNEANGYKTSATIILYKKNITKDLYGHIYLNVNSIGTNLASEQSLKWAIYEGTTDTGTPINAGNFNGEAVNNRIPLDINILLSAEETQYTIVLSLDESKVKNTNIVSEKIVAQISAEVSTASDATDDESPEGLYNSLYINSVSNEGYQISATAKDFRYDIVRYQVTTTSTQPTSWETLTANKDQSISYTVDNAGTYYIWVKNSNDDVVSKNITINDINKVVPVSDVIITKGSMDTTYFNQNSKITIPIIVNSTKDISDALTSEEVKVLVDGVEVSGVNKTLKVSDNNNNKFYDLILEGLFGNGELRLSISSGSVKNSDNEVNNDTSLIIGTLDNIKPSCSFGTIPIVTKNVNFDVELTCTDTGAGLVWSGITTDRLTTLDNDLKIVSVSTPTAVTNGYKYTVTLNTSAVKSSGYSLTLKADTVWDNSGNYNDKVTSSIISGPSGGTYTVTFTKGSNVSSIGSTSLSCTTSGNSNTCEVTAPTITATSGFQIGGWHLSGSTKYITPGDKITVGGNVTYIAEVADNTKPSCTITTPGIVEYGENTTATITCTDNVGIPSTTLTTSNFASSNTSIATIQSVSSPTTITNGYKYTVTLKGVGAGTYTLSINAGVISDTAGNTNDGATSGTATIGKRKVTYKADSVSKVYDETALTKQTATLTSGSLVSGHTATFSISGTITNVGSVTNTLNSVTIKSGTTDVTSNYDITKENGTLTITKASVTKPTTSYCSTPTYNGSSQTITKAAGSGYSFSGNTGTNAGSYTVTATLDGNHQWRDGTTANVTFSCSIAQATPTITLSSTTGTVGYNQSATFMATTKSSPNAAGTLTATSGTTSVITITGGASSSITATSSGVSSTITYKAVKGTGSSSITVKFTPTDTTNFKTVTATFTATASKIDDTITITSADAIYDGNTHSATASSTSQLTVSLTYYSDSSCSTKTTTSNAETSGGPPKTVGTYYAIGKTAGNDNYNITTSACTKAVTISQSDNPLTVTGKTVTYNTTAQVLATASNAQGTVYYAIGTQLTSSNYSSAGSTTIPTKTDVGSYTIYYYTPGNTNYKASSGSVTGKINQYNLSNATIASIANQTYSGSAKTPTSTVTVPIPSGSTTTLTSGTNFTYSYSNNTNAGTATVTITGKGNYTGTKTANFTINPKSISSSDITISLGSTSVEYDGSAQTVSVTVKDETRNAILSSTNDYSVSYSNNTNVGTATVTITGKGNYTGSVNKTFTITYKTYEITLNSDGATSAGTETLYGRVSDGVYLDSSYSKKMSTSANKITNPTKSYTVTYNNNYTGSTNTTVTSNSTFNGYYDGTTQMIGTSGYITSNFTSTKYSSDTTLTAKWTNGSVTLPTSTRSGYTCEGWYTAASGGTKVGNCGAGYTVTSNITLYAHWTANIYTITLDNQSATSAGTTAIYEKYGVGIYSNSSATTSISKITVPSRTNYTFGGYYTSKNGGGTQVIAADGTINIANNAYSANTTIYAKWTATATFYYYNSGIKNTTVSCTTDSSTGKCDVTIPSAVKGNTGQYAKNYAGLANAFNTMTVSVSKTATTINLSGNANYYSTYSDALTIYYPSSASVCSKSTSVAYRNSYFGSTSAMTTKISGSTTSTSDLSSISGIAGTFNGLSTSVNSTTTTALSTLANSTTTTYYAVSNTSVTVTFYYNSNTTVGSLTVSTATASGNRSNYCTSTSAATQVDGSVTVPSVVTSSVGQYNNAYSGNVATATGTMSGTGSPTTANSTYYAIYQTQVTRYYYNSSAWKQETDYRNSWFTSTSAMSTVISDSTTGTTNISTAAGPGSSGFVGYSTAKDTTAEYTTVDAAVKSNATTLYTVYKMSVTYAKGSNVSSIGSTSGSCSLTYNSTSCSVTTPSITANSGYASVGWNTTSGAISGTAAGSSLTLSTSGQTYYGNAVAQNYAITSNSSCGSYSTYAATLADAVSLANSGNLICVYKAVTDSSTVTIPSGKTLTLNLNGKTITKTTAGITNGGTLTVNGSSGTISMSTGTNDIILIKNTGTLTISGSPTLSMTKTITGNNFTSNYIINSSGSVQISGGTITTPDRAVYINNGTFNMTGGTINVTNKEGYAPVKLHGTASGKMSGGTISNTNGSSTANRNYAVVLGDSDEGTAAKESFSMSGGTLTNGIITYSTKSDAVTISGSSKITPGSENAVYCVGCSGSINVEGGTITLDSGNGIYSNSNGTATINISGGKILGNKENTNTINNDLSTSLVYVAGSSPLNITSSARLVSYGQYGIYAHSDYTGTININATKLSKNTTDEWSSSNSNITTKGGVTKALIYVNSTNAKLNITSGYIYAYLRAIRSVGTLKITGGTIRATTNSDNVSSDYAIRLDGSGAATIGTNGGSKVSPVIWNSGNASAIYSSSSNSGDLTVYGGVIYSSGCSTESGSIGSAGNGISLYGTGTTRLHNGYFESTNGRGVQISNGRLLVNASGIATTGANGVYLASVNYAALYVKTGSSVSVYVGDTASTGSDPAPTLVTGGSGMYALYGEGSTKSVHLRVGRFFTVDSSNNLNWSDSAIYSLSCSASNTSTSLSSIWSSGAGCTDTSAGTGTNSTHLCLDSNFKITLKSRKYCTISS